jgi:hypothetical protein
MTQSEPIYDRHLMIGTSVLRSVDRVALVVGYALPAESPSTLRLAPFASWQPTHWRDVVPASPTVR